MTGEVAVRIVEEIAAVNETDPSALDFAIGEHVDLEAVDRLVTQTDGFGELRFHVPDHEIVITGPDSVSVEPVQASPTTHAD